MAFVVLLLVALAAANCPGNAAEQELAGTAFAGHGVTASWRGSSSPTLYVLRRFDNCVVVWDSTTNTAQDRISVPHEPVAADLTKDGRFLLIANHLPAGRSDSAYCGAVVSVIDTAKRKLVKELRLPNGSGSLKDIRISRDGKYAAVTHLIANFRQPAIRPFPDWMNGNALTIIEVARLELVGSVLLDERGKGAANPWGIAWSEDGGQLVVAHAGTHEVSIINFPALLEFLMSMPAPPDPAKAADPLRATQEESEVASYLPYIPTPRRRIRLPSGDLGPRDVAVVGHTAYTTNWFSRNITAIDLAAVKPQPVSIALFNCERFDPRTATNEAVKGEFYFHDATIGFQGWQSCASCHPDGRADGLNWDLINDGIRNPKNTKSLLMAFDTPPAMWLGVRETAQTAVRAGIKHILFAEPQEGVARALDAYIKSLRPTVSPHLVRGKFSDAAKRGERVFQRAGCAACHPPPLFTDLQQYNVGTRRAFDKTTDKFDTPSLIELWRTAPYLHDGSAAVVRDVVTVQNHRDRHGETTQLTPQEIDDLCEYLLSL